MSDLLLDVSYMRSAYRCFRGEANCKADIVNFYRILAEIIAHKEIYIKVNKNGPVYEKAAECLEFFKSISQNKFEIHLLDSQKVNYQQIIEKVTSHLKNFNISSFFRTTKHYKDISPEFSTNIHPDVSFHEWLIASNTESSKFTSIDDGTYAPIIIGKQLGLKEHFKKLPKNDWNISKSIALAAQLRSHIYIEMGKRFNLNYVPSATRGYNSNFSFKSPSLRDLLFVDIGTYEEFKKCFNSNESVISGIIYRNNCVPTDCLLDSLELREKTKALRAQLYKKPFFKSGDSLLLYQYSKLEELKRIKNEYISNGKLIFGIEDLNPTISATSVDPSIELSMPIVGAASKALDFGHKAKILKNMQSLILPIVQANFSNPTKLLKILKYNSGLDE